VLKSSEVENGNIDHEAHEEHEGFGNYYISMLFLHALRDLRGEMFVSILVAVCRAGSFVVNPFLVAAVAALGRWR
jgi:hypothetical protein